MGRLMAEETIESPLKSIIRRPHHNRWLMLIAAFKLAQALLFIAAGISVLRLMHHDLPDLVLQWARHMHFSPESHFVDFILERAAFVNDKVLRRFSVGLFAYATLGAVEGIGLYLEKTWAEYMTLGITASFLPWEIFEVIRRLTYIRSALLAVNILVFFYLLKVVTERTRRSNGEAPTAAS